MGRQVKILVTNDDGVHSRGLWLLYEAARPYGRVYVLAPETPKSASGLGITLHKPLRLERVKLWDGVEAYITNGTPSDIVYLALNELSPSFDLVASGVNIGDNTSVQVILSSGTVGAAAQAALMGIPAVAFSAAVDEGEELEGEYGERVAALTREIIGWLLENGLPEGVDLLNVNYPSPSKWSGKVRIAPPARIRFLQKVTLNYDPRGRKYYWLYGQSLEPEEGTDAYAVHVEGAVTLTPINLSLTPCGDLYSKAVKGLEDLARRLSRITGGGGV